ncbi:MAG: hypothetical protein HN356_09025 [Calditrichaeota bacterium]|jgi:hypothetical protein|nr:hypothetical protein [Calditrichota bacterium]MBT7617014.1 hypothetical protein [Calditrichota bacterium]MBT7787663.1 hypothetical protein [Calditrichota bacterium]
MFLTLLIVTFLTAFGVSLIIVMLFKKSLGRILNRIINDEISVAWSKYMMFAIFVVGISSGVRIRALEKYITADQVREGAEVIVLNMDRWILELYRTIIGTLQGVAWMLLVFFVFSLIAYVIVKIFEGKKSKELKVTESGGENG